MSEQKIGPTFSQQQKTLQTKVVLRMKPRHFLIDEIIRLNTELHTLKAELKKEKEAYEQFKEWHYSHSHL